MDAIFTLTNLKQVIPFIWKEGATHKVWAFNAEMGAGKTTFIHALCEWLGVTDTVSSPTYALMNEYQSPKNGKIYHMDWYRVKDEDEAIEAGLEEAVNSGNRCFVEWPEKAMNILPETTWHLYIEVLDSETRRIYSEK
jgi:tRNA threonylcarbamoyladenosine biosynthesis protein TsaE